MEDVKLTTFEAVQKFKSIKRAIKRGHINATGVIFPKRPFNNRGNTSDRLGVHSKVTNEVKKQIYAEYKERRLQ